MPWNEPGDPSKNKDPWTGRPKQNPPDLEAFLRDLVKKIVALFKLRILNKKSAFARPFLPTKLNAKSISLISIFCLLAWLALGFFKVNMDESAVITRFGAYSTTLGSGYHWILKPFQHYTIINSGKVTTLSTHVKLLTQDENKIAVDVDIDYSIVNPHNYLFATVDPLLHLEETLHSVINRVLSQFTLNQLQTISHLSLAERLQKQLNTLTIKQQTGLAIKNIELASIQIPKQLQASFIDAANAKSDKEQLEKLANVYAIQVEPRAQALAQRFIADAKAYQQEIVLKAKTDIIRFLALLPAYEASPALTRKRLYLSALQTMMAHSNKLIVANNANTNFSLALDQIQTTSPVNTETAEKTPTSASNDKKPSIEIENESSNKTNDTIPSSYNISGGYE
ncbi:FtsH protease activity modulator HflK [Rickettsiella endosymbiont of Miltochrista miniata]|uniref:FtsH protease activity modulator HflK n=1 Tax=Rickettsiella endosymbiont of Miltochrista miniata TaxID=3066239 RepID=UPI00313C9206